MDDRERQLLREASLGDAEAVAQLRTLRARRDPVTEVGPGAEVRCLGRLWLVLRWLTPHVVHGVRLEDDKEAQLAGHRCVPTGRSYPLLIEAIEATARGLVQGATIRWQGDSWEVDSIDRSSAEFLSVRLYAKDRSVCRYVRPYSPRFWRGAVAQHLLPTPGERRGVEPGGDSLQAELASLWLNQINHGVALAGLVRAGPAALAELAAVFVTAWVTGRVPDPVNPAGFRRPGRRLARTGARVVAKAFGEIVRTTGALAEAAEVLGGLEEGREELREAVLYRARDYLEDHLRKALTQGLPTAELATSILLKRRGKIALDLLEVLAREGPTPAHQELARARLTAMDTVASRKLLGRLEA